MPLVKCAAANSSLILNFQKVAWNKIGSSVESRWPINIKAMSMLNPNVAKAGGLQSQEEPLSKMKLEASARKAGASEGES